MSQRLCPECEGDLFYDAPMKLFVCKKCGLYADRDTLSDIKYAKKDALDDTSQKNREQSEYLEWWLTSKKDKSQS